MAARMLPLCSRAILAGFRPQIVAPVARHGLSTATGSAQAPWIGSRKKTLFLLAGGGAIALASGATYLKFTTASASGPTKGEQMIPTSWQNLGQPPNVVVSRKVTGPNALPGIRLTLFQYQTCPFCCKVRAFLDYAGIPYDVVEVDPVLRQQTKFSQYKKVPILLLQEGGNCWQLNDSSVIISVLQSYLLNSAPGIRSYLDLYQPVKIKDARGKEVLEVFNKYNIMKGSTEETPDAQTISSETQWRRWADNHFVHVLSPNVYRSPKEALQAFNYFSKAGDWERLFPAWERYLVIYVGATAMFLVGKRLQKKHHLKDDVRLSFYEACDTWTDHLGTSKFSGGNEPNLADLAVYGVLSSVEGCTAFGDVLKNTKIQRWYDDMKLATERGDSITA